MQGAALIVQVENAVMMIVVGRGNSHCGMTMRVARDRRRFKYVEGVLVDQWHDTGDLGDDEKPQEARVQATNRSSEHRLAELEVARPSVRPLCARACGNDATVVRNREPPQSCGVLKRF